jgi:ribosomal protein L13
LRGTRSSRRRRRAPHTSPLTLNLPHTNTNLSTVARPAVVAAATTATPTPSAGPDLWNRTYYPRAGDTSKDVKPWYLVDAEGQTLGRLASTVAQLVRGKQAASYTPSSNTGAYVVIINAEKVTVTGNKSQDKLYRRHTGRPGSMKTETFRALQARIPERIVEKAVRGMLPSGKLGNELFRQLKVYKGAAHPHEAQAPVDVTAGVGAKSALPVVSA